MNYTMEELVPVVSWLAERYTQKDSTSVTYETAEMLMEAVIYCITQVEEVNLPDSVCLGFDAGGSRQMDTQGHPIGPMTTEIEQADFKLRVEKERKAPGTMRNSDGKAYMDAERLYHRGYEMVIEKARRAKDLYEAILSDFKAYGNKAYSDTIIKRIPQFFLWYDARFKPQDHLLVLDYPVLKHMESLKGVNCILSYLECIALEQKFLGRLMAEHVREILFGFHEGYEDLIINVSSVVWRDLIGRMMAGKEGNKPGFTEEELSRVEALVYEKTDIELKQWITGLNESFFKRFYGGDQALSSYLEQDLGDFIVELRRDTEHGCLERLFVW